MTARNEFILEHLQTPALIVADGQVSFANLAARALLGNHIVGEDVRIAIRDPDAVAAILGEAGGNATITGLSIGGSVWEVDCSVIGGGERLVTLYDRSVQVRTARAHADFVANASHELRTPLATILGYVETLEDSRAGSDEETRLKFLETIRHEAQRMQALVSDLMSLSRIEANKHEAPRNRVDLAELVRAIKGEFGEKFPIDIETNRDSIVVLGDRAQLSQVLRNLVDNAGKYGRTGGTVSIALEASDTGWVLLAVRDEGDGIPPEHLPRLTERFYRADTSRSRAAGGTGLGLSIVKHIVERHRGRFDIASRQGKGTSATIMLPLAAA